MQHGAAIYAATLNPKLIWYISRSSGLVALALVSASLIWGLAVSSRFTKKLPPPAWTLDLHRFLGGLSVSFTFIHVLSLWGHHYIKYGWKDLIIPFHAHSIKFTHATKIAVAWGVIGFWILLAVEVTSLMMKHLPRKLWRYIHYSSFGLFVLVMVHALMAGTDAAKPQVRWASLIVCVLTVLFFWIRLKLPKHRRAKRERLAAANQVKRVAGAPVPPTSSGVAVGPAIEKNNLSAVEWSPNQAPDDRAARIAALKAARAQSSPDRPAVVPDPTEPAAVGDQPVVQALPADRAARIAALKAARAQSSPPAPPSVDDTVQTAVVETAVVEPAAIEAAAIETAAIASDQNDVEEPHLWRYRAPESASEGDEGAIEDEDGEHGHVDSETQSESTSRRPLWEVTE